MLLLLLELGSDRPDNAQLLLQSDAQWLRADTDDGVPVDVFAGPSAPVVSGETAAGPNPGRLRYWVDGTGRLLRFEVDLPTGMVSVGLNHSGFAPFPQAAELR